MSDSREHKHVPKDDETTENLFLEAFEAYSDALFRHAVLRLSDRERAIDVVHDTFTKAWSYLRDGYQIDAFRPFLYKVLNNLIIDEYRKKREASLDQMFSGEGIDERSFSDLSEDTTESLVASLDGRQAFELLESLPDNYKEVIILRYIDGLGPKEISELIEVSENVVSVRLHRGLAMLKAQMDSEEGKREANRNSDEYK